MQSSNIMGDNLYLIKIVKLIECTIRGSEYYDIFYYKEYHYEKYA